MIEIRESNVHGLGIFANVDIEPNIIIYKAFIKLSTFNASSWIETYIATYQNHSLNSNANIVIRGSKILIVSSKLIKANEEVLVDYNELINLLPEFSNILDFKLQQ